MGYPLIGWVIALVWACTADTECRVETKPVIDNVGANDAQV